MVPFFRLSVSLFAVFAVCLCLGLAYTRYMDPCVCGCTQQKKSVGRIFGKTSIRRQASQERGPPHTDTAHGSGWDGMGSW
ncbi:hypothetical protein CCHR01_11114 [Colletotrichum chrysophilum]|uniref:Secreted protein n=1 Tax=Colletotrichum chrysophilum TaxID=1836956 RepID=A0AAD9AFC3_9PEZI|nr:hypothetical protein CCHR01_11114 [Colletotrichum chrysophilum]